MINMQEFLSKKKSAHPMIELLQSKIEKELRKAYLELDYDDIDDFIDLMKEVYLASKRQFVILKVLILTKCVGGITVILLILY